MRDPLGCIASSDIHSPFSLHRTRNEAFPPERFGETRAIACYVFKRLLGYASNANAGDGADGVIHFPQNKHVVIAQVAGQKKCNDLPLSILGSLVTASPTRKDDIDFIRLLAFANNVLVGTKATDALRRESQQGGGIGARQLGRAELSYFGLGGQLATARDLSV